ncbi:MAG: NUDIX hydrolase [Tenericutes bacterium]|nr:NUDIX hydrolase [Mycoplasmatota bacterium]
MKLEEKRLTHELVYKNLFMNIYLDDVLLPNNKKSKRIYLEHDGAAAVLPITETGKIVLIRQFRYPINKVIYEIPAGKKDTSDELGLDCASRELEEETGYVSSDFSKYIDLHNCVGYSSEVIELFVAKNCKKIDHPRKGDDDEFIEVVLLEDNEVLKLLKDGEITDAKTLAILQYYFLEKLNL